MVIIQSKASTKISFPIFTQYILPLSNPRFHKKLTLLRYHKGFSAKVNSGKFKFLGEKRKHPCKTKAFFKACCLLLQGILYEISKVSFRWSLELDSVKEDWVKKHGLMCNNWFNSSFEPPSSQRKNWFKIRQSQITEIDTKTKPLNLFIIFSLALELNEKP